MTKDEIKNYSKKYDNSFDIGLWKNDFDTMAKKTVIKNLLKDAPLSTYMQRAISFDESIDSQIDN